MNPISVAATKIQNYPEQLTCCTLQAHAVELKASHDRLPFTYPHTRYTILLGYIYRYKKNPVHLHEPSIVMHVLCMPLRCFHS